jgi:alpha-galactosidase
MPKLHALLSLPVDGDLEVDRSQSPAPRPLEHGSIIDADSIEVRYPWRAASFYRHGWHSFSVARWQPLPAPVTVVGSESLRIGGDDPVHGLSHRHGSSAVAAVERCEDNGRVLLVGAVGLGGRVEWTDTSLAGAVEEPPGRWYVAYGHEQDVFGEYTQLLGRRFGKRPSPVPRTWMSWYSLFDEIDEACLSDILGGLAGLPFDCFIIDDGWERAIGDWQPSERFSSGMAGFAARIRATGMRPGLWLAPFLAPEHGPVVHAHPDWFVRDATGSLVRAGEGWGGDYFGLDLTHPDAIAYLTELIERIVGWGFSLLKLDFLFAGAIPGLRHREQGRESAYRAGIQAIRDAAGDDTFLLGCGAPIIPSLGIFDAIRIGPDAAPYWENPLARQLAVQTEPSARQAIATSLHRLWLAPIIGLDPDVVYFRSRRQLLTPRQQGLLQDVARICDCRSSSDPPAWLDPGERAALTRFLTERSSVDRLGRYRFRIDGREVNFLPLIGGG